MLFWIAALGLERAGRGGGSNRAELLVRHLEYRIDNRCGLEIGADIYHALVNSLPFTDGSDKLQVWLHGHFIFG